MGDAERQKNSLLSIRTTDLNMKTKKMAGMLQERV